MNNIPKGVTVHPSSYSVKESIDRIHDFLQQQGITIYTRIDQQKELDKAGLKMGALEYLLFGSPKAGGPVMQVSPVSALDLPLKVIAWEDDQKKVWLAYNQMGYIRERFDLPEAVSAPLNLDGLMAKLFGK